MNTTAKAGPKAPKDPTKKRPFFSIMKNKAIAGSPQKDGTGIQFIYENDGRIMDAARLVGNMTDESVISMLKETASFKKLVHSIGVSVETEDSEPVEFVFQMYGKTDLYGSGTLIKAEVTGDNFEKIIDLSEVEWSDDDDLIGQIRFVFKKAGALGKATVRLYLQDGFTAPLEEDENPVDFNSLKYQNMIKKSLMNLGNNVRLKKAIDKARRGEDTTVAFIGGSITQGAGAIPINTECYAYKAFKGFCDLAGCKYDGNVHYVKAGVGGTPSELGMLRYERDVCDDGNITPDVVIVEFAVNDEGDETKGECFEALTRKILNSKGAPAVILLFAVFSNDWNLQERLKPVGYTLDLPMVSTFDSVVPQFNKKGDEKVVSKNQYFYDCYHPTNTGHTIMADGLINLFKVTDNSPYDNKDIDVDNIKPFFDKEFETVILLDKNNILDAKIDAGDFTDTDTELQYVERNLDLKGTPEFPFNWQYRGIEGREGVSFKMDIECSALLIIFKDSASNNDGIAKVYVDGVETLNLNPRDVGWTHCDPVIVFRKQEKKLRHIEVVPDKNKNFTLLGFGVIK